MFVQYTKDTPLQFLLSTRKLDQGFEIFMITYDNYEEIGEVKRFLTSYRMFFSDLNPNWNSGVSNGGSGVILRRKNIARRPSHLRSKSHQGFDKNGCLKENMVIF